MQFIIADSFTTSLRKLTPQERAAVSATVFELQANPAHPSFKYHSLDKGKDKRFHSVRVNDDLRLIVHRTDESFLVCYVGHHDDAYRWGENRKLQTHPVTGAAQIVEVRETVVEIPVYVEVEVKREKRPLFKHVSDEKLLRFGVPPEWLDDVRNLYDEESLLKLVDHLPSEASDALLSMYDGVMPSEPVVVEEVSNPFEHPDAKRRFSLMTDSEELKTALEYPWDQWIVFLHPAQRQFVDKDFNGPARVTGSAGTGKTVVAMHRAVHLARRDETARILLATFSDTLAVILKQKLRILVASEPKLAERIEIHAMKSLGRRFYELRFNKPQLIGDELVSQLIEEGMALAPESKLNARFLTAEWNQVVDAQQVLSCDEYLNAPRIGRRTGLNAKQRTLIWPIFQHVLDQMTERGLVTDAGIFRRLTEEYHKTSQSPFEHTIIDEAQDINPSQLRFLAAINGKTPNGLFFAGDVGQRIFQIPFSWLSLGVDVRGRSKGLKINYRTSHQIRSRADRLLGAEVADYDGIFDERKGTVSVFNGPQPMIQVFDNEDDECIAVADWVRNLLTEGFEPHEISVVVRSKAQVPRAEEVMKILDAEYQILDDRLEVSRKKMSVGTMHMTKGLEFRAVAVMACDYDVIPLQERVESITDDLELREVYDTERHLLYVACTRARDQLLVTAAGDPSEFLDDLRLD
jgi:mRNA-degrading endonuclease RelE of RelBE toxin-antitoxin system